MSVQTPRKKNDVVVVLKYNPAFARATISFGTQRPDLAVLGAKAELVDGVAHAMPKAMSNTKELEFTITDFHAQTRQMAEAVLAAVLKTLRLNVINLRVEINNDPKKPKKPGEQRIAHPAMPVPPHSRLRGSRRP